MKTRGKWAAFASPPDSLTIYKAFHKSPLFWLTHPLSPSAGFDNFGIQIKKKNKPKFSSLLPTLVQNQRNELFSFSSETANFWHEEVYTSGSRKSFRCPGFALWRLLGDTVLSDLVSQTFTGAWTLWWMLCSEEWREASVNVGVIY